jgi:hypothetical protein
MGKKDPLAVGSNYFNQGSTMSIEQDGKVRIMTFNYEPISHPPLHPHCRCTLIPIVAEGGKMYMIIYDKWFRIA